ncbi:rod shape-determining protein [Candidatus Albibeggiatoa sp. nov. NOAA]|uniref:rod shape-determining protein n=1 Tax=Candidatus Albibeggiatoa sp. nov. NOAA TaxID=3162724 RepID=UPI0032F8A89C|nr:rod shape-determining protein [Thiotrichaceae bacterium]
MLSFIQKLFIHDLLVELSKEKMTVQSLSDANNSIYEDAPWIAIKAQNNKETIVGVGIKAKSMAGANIKVVNPFDHSRSFVASFNYAEKILQYSIHTFCKSRFLRPSPKIVMHQLEKTEGGLTDIEERVLIELAKASGAVEVLVYTGSRINPKIDSFKSIKARLNDSANTKHQLKFDL